MEPRDLQQMTVSQLRDLALERNILTDVHGMDKQQLLEALAPALGIDLEAAAKASRSKLAADKTTIKREIRTLKTQRDDALASGDQEAVAEARRGIKLRKRELRRRADQGRTAAV
jgi:hypothetical protein